MEEQNKVINLQHYINSNQKLETIRDFQQMRIGIIPNNVIAKRFWAFLVDICFISVLNIMVMQSYTLFVSKFFAAVPYSKRMQLMQGNFFLNIGIFITIYTSYFFYTNYVLNGKTLGKKIMKLRVVNQDFIFDQSQVRSDLSIRNSFQRAIGYLLCYASFGIFFIFHFASEDKRGLPDFLSATQTVSDEWIDFILDSRSAQAELIYLDIQELSIAA